MRSPDFKALLARLNKNLVLLLLFTNLLLKYLEEKDPRPRRKPPGRSSRDTAFPSISMGTTDNLTSLSNSLYIMFENFDLFLNKN
jgi:hypothetical protein